MTVYEVTAQVGVVGKTNFEEEYFKKEEAEKRAKELAKRIENESDYVRIKKIETKVLADYYVGD